MTSFEDIFKKKAIYFLENIFESAGQNNIEINELFLDHICYRVETLKEFQEARLNLSKIGSILIESIVGGRKITTFKLHNGISFLGRDVFIIELPEPKRGSYYKTGFEHAEFVISESFKNFANKYSHVEFDWNGAGKDHNPELRIRFNNGLSIKFHHKSLEEVISEEN